MESVTVRAYVSPRCVFLAFDVPGVESIDELTAPSPPRNPLLGFAIERSPGVGSQSPTFLPNLLGFGGALKQAAPSNQNPIQKFTWWDSQIGDSDEGVRITYTVIPVFGTGPNDLVLDRSIAGSVDVVVQSPVVANIGTWFNRAVVSSQAFAREFGADVKGKTLTGSTLLRALHWLGNGMEMVVPKFIADSPDAISGAIYHLTDESFIIPALKQYRGDAQLVYDGHTVASSPGAPPEDPNDQAISELRRVQFFSRTKTNIMHDKFIVRLSSGKPVAVTMGSANYTTEGLSTQANVIHTWNSPELAALYYERALAMQSDPKKSQIAQRAQWSSPIQIDDATVRVIFSPESSNARASLDAIVESVKAAKGSIFFCLFDPTDAKIRDAIFETADAKKLAMYGLINHLPPRPPAKQSNSAQQAAYELFHRSVDDHDVVAFSSFGTHDLPTNFWPEFTSLKGMTPPGPKSVFIHHKFIVIDGETTAPTIYVGSQNLSNNSVHNNDENLLEITGSPRLAEIYVAEFMRLYDHYRARLAFERDAASRGATGLGLTTDASWATKYFDDAQHPETVNAREHLAAPLEPLPQPRRGVLQREPAESGDESFAPGRPARKKPARNGRSRVHSPVG